jgi:malonyl-CoA O-methyltransferase
VFSRWQRDAEGRLPASFEIVFGHAWKAEPKVAADGRAIVRFAK